VIVQTRARVQAARVADLTGGALLHDDQGRLTAKATLGDFDAHREAVESVSVLFRCFDDDGTEVPSGWVVTGATFEVEWPREPERRSLIRSHFGARRFAKNWAIAQVKADLDARKTDWFTLASLETPDLGFLVRWWCCLVQRRPARTPPGSGLRESRESRAPDIEARIPR